MAVGTLGGDISDFRSEYMKRKYYEQEAGFRQQGIRNALVQQAIIGSEHKKPNKVLLLLRR